MRHMKAAKAAVPLSLKAAEPLNRRAAVPLSLKQADALNVKAAEPLQGVGTASGQRRAASGGVGGSWKVSGLFLAK